MTDLLKLAAEAERQLAVCNACRFCEQYCAVFPALERRLVVLPGDAQYLANLCHDCGACLQACPYSPPHQLGVNIPKALGDLRVATYSRYTWPRRGAKLFEHAAASAVILTAVGAIAAIAAILLFSGADALFKVDTVPGSFYRVVPWLAMLIPSLSATLFAVIVIAIGSRNFWKEIGSAGTAFSWKHAYGALNDAARLRYLDGGGPGCYYPDRMRPSTARRFNHHAVAYGFALCFASTIAAAFEQDVLMIQPPYPLLSVPVLLGTIGGIAIIVGAAGLLIMKLQAAIRRSTGASTPLDVSFLVLLLAASISGLLLLALRDSPAMGSLLAAHLAILVALYLTFPYGKFVHAVYRYVALVKNRSEANLRMPS
jgi:citrate/tricarballylate utilization protein